MHRLRYGENGQPLLDLVTEDRLLHQLRRCAHWQTGSKAASAHKTLAKDMLAAPNKPLPVLERTVEAPVFSPNGELRTRPGYDPPSRLYFHFPDELAIHVPEDPSDEEIRSATDLILEEWLGDFPFVGPADRANVLAVILLPFVRKLVAGPTPLHMTRLPSRLRVEVSR